MDRRTVLAGDTLARGFTMVAKASGSPIVAGTVNHYLKAITGANAGKWWRDSDQTWQVAETANAMTHQADGHWTRVVTATPWTAGELYLEYAKESGDLHVPTGWMLVASYTPSADSSRRVDLGLWLGSAPDALSSGKIPADLKLWLAVAPLALSAQLVQTVANDLGTTAKAAVNTEADAALTDIGATSARMGYLDNANVGGLLASAAGLAAITQAQRVRVLPPALMERPDSGAGSLAYRIWIYAYDEQHKAEDLDANPTVTAENNAGTDRSANLGTVTKPGATTGQYYVDYTVPEAHAIEGLVFKVAAVEGAVTTNYAAPSIVVDTTAVDFTTADRTKLEAIHTRASEARLAELDAANLPTDVAAVFSRLGAPAGASVSADILAVKTDTGNLVTRITSTLFSGITSLAQWLGLIAGKQTGNSTARTELRATGAGSGTYDETTDSQEAIRDRGDSAWLTGGGVSGSNAVVITVRDSVSLEPLIDVPVVIFGADGTTLVDAKRTDNTGDADFALNSAAYFYAVPPVAGYASQSNTALTVDGAEAVTVNLVAIPAASVSAGTRVVRVIVVNGSGALTSGIVVTARLVTPKSSIASAFALNTQLTDTTDINGIADLTLLTSDQFTAESGDGEYVITVPGAGEWRLAIPAGSGALNLQVQVTS